MTEVHPKSIIDQATAATSALFDEKAGVKLIKKIPKELPTITADKDRLIQVVINLLSNAVRYTPENGQIKASAEQVGDQVEIKIKDSGVGIDPADLPHVFDRFYRSDKARSREKSMRKIYANRHNKTRAEISLRALLS